MMREFDDLIAACKDRVRPAPHEYPIHDYPWGIQEVGSVDELTEHFRFGNYAVRTGFVLGDLAFIEQVSGGNEWLALKLDEGDWKSFDSISFYHMINNNGEGACGEYIEHLRETPWHDLKYPSEPEGPTMMPDSCFPISETVCATTPDKHHYIILCAQNTQNGDTVWAIGDDQVCAVTREDCIRNGGINYNDVLIQEFPYEDNTPESVGSWRPLIEELVRNTLRKYLEHDGLVHVYPQWLPADVSLSMGGDEYQKIKDHLDHVILYDDNTMEMVPSRANRNLESPSEAEGPTMQM